MSFRERSITLPSYCFDSTFTECYHRAPMSHHPVIDGLEFARVGAALEGRWRLADFPRLKGALRSDAGELSWSLRGGNDAQGRPCLEVGLQGSLRLTCQRCLGELEFPVRIDSVVILAATQEEIDAAATDLDAPDRVLAHKEMQVHELLEEELLLAVPYAPRHEACAATQGAAAEARVSPFSGLRGLMHGKSRTT